MTASTVLYTVPGTTNGMHSFLCPYVVHGTIYTGTVYHRRDLLMCSHFGVFALGNTSTIYSVQ